MIEVKIEVSKIAVYDLLFWKLNRSMDAMWIRQELERVGATQAQLGEAIGLTSVQVNKILTGVRGIKAAEADRIRAFFGSETIDAPTRVDSGDEVPDGLSLVAVYDLSASAGYGTLVEYETVAYKLAFPPDYLTKLTRSNPRNLAIISVNGESMLPTLKDDDIVMVDISKRNIGYDGMFVIRHLGVVKVKRLRLLPDRQFKSLISDNAAVHPPEVWPAEEVEVIGRVIWVGGKV